MTQADELLSAVLDLFARNVRAEQYNGVRLEQLSLSLSDENVDELIRDLISQRKLDCLGPETLNPHIKRFQAPHVDSQLASLNVREKYHTCLYPSPDVIKSAIDLSFLNGKPFSQQLAQAAAQIEPIFFEVSALERYRQDPRYAFYFNGYAGRMSISVSEGDYERILERDRVFVETFGLGLDEERHPVVAVFRRYLASLTAEHQQYWNSFIRESGAKIHEYYYKPTILGEFYTNNGALAALDAIIQEINRVCEAIVGRKLFREGVPGNPHYNLTPFMKPTKVDFFSFVHELDKLIGENLIKQTIVGLLEKSNISLSESEKNFGTIALLDKYLFSGEISWASKDDARAAIIQPIREVRKLRQSPAHLMTENKYDPGVYKERRRILAGVTIGLGSMMHVLRKYPGVPAAKLPRWLEENEIEII